MSTEHLIDRLPEAALRAPGPDHVAVQPMTIHRDTRMALFQHPASTVEFPAMMVGAGGRLRFACGIKQIVWARLRSPVLFEVAAGIPGEAKRILFTASVDPRRHAEARRWIETELDLSPLAGRTVRLVFRTSVPAGGDSRYAWAGWADPRLVHEAPEPPRPRARSGGHPLVLLVTADALRPDFLGCYGHPRVKTPHLDALARDGCLMRHARAQTGTSIGSYTSVLTGQHVPGHGIAAEWGRLPAALPTLPVYLRAFGYHTVLAPSDTELCDRELGLVDLFAEQVPCLARPGQDGSITTRRWMDWLDRRPDQPCFVWIEYFDTHPPATPPEPFRSMYYQGDPGAPERAHRADDVAKIRGIEVVQEIEQALPALARGVPDMAITAKLLATVAVWRGAPSSGPDLAAHLGALGAEARRGLAIPRFAEWLDRQVAAMRAGSVPREAVAWLGRLLPMLKEIEADITSWLEGVVDFRYPVSQYMAGVSYLDHHVGRLVEALRERDLYERSMLVFLSPHGEALGERGVYFHHHTLMEASLRIPVIVKPPASAAAARGARIGGVFDSVDVFPTLVEALGLPVPPAPAGRSRWPQLRDGSDIPPHESFAVNNHESMLALTLEPYKLLRALADHRVSPEWTWKAGDRALFDLRHDAPDTADLADRLPDVVASLEARLEAWRHGPP